MTPTPIPEPSTTSKESTNCVGLVNQGSTCYMNSLLQSLFHLPIFRRLVFTLPTNGAEPIATSIPLTLQRLFGRLQTSSTACSTESFTVSLGWTTAETFIQHDAQEFGRVLLDNLERKLEGTSLETAIADLFRGTVSHKIQCLNVNYETSRDQDFYELSVQVKDCGGLEESLGKYIEKELLTGENQYATENDGKQDAEMGVEIVRLPIVWHVHLTRFMYDMETFRPIKVNSKFEFPREFDAAKFVRNSDGELIYELFGVLVHSGGTLGGHYFAYLRVSPEFEFFKFNDAVVTRESLDQAIEDNFGGAGKLHSAYMLVYVKRDAIARVFEAVGDDAMPAHIRDYLVEIAAEEEREKAERVRKTMFADIFVGLEADVVANVERKVSGFLPIDERSVSVSKSLTLNGLYARLAGEYGKRVDEIRVWETNYQRVPSFVVLPSDEITVESMQLGSVFIQFKEGSEAAGVTPSNILVWVKFFYQNRETIEYVSSWLIDRSGLVSELIPMIIGKLGLPANTELWLFREANDGKTAQLNLAESGDFNQLQTGSIVIAQYLPGQDPNPSTSAHVVVTREPIDGITPVEYRDVFPDEPPATVDEFLSASTNMFYVELFNMEEPSDAPLSLLHISRSLAFTKLKRMIARLLHLNYSPENDAIILYRITDPKTHSMSQMDTSSVHPTIGNYAGPPGQIKKQQFLFQIIEGTNEELVAHSSRYTVQFSRDGIRVETDTKVLAPKSATVRQIFESTGIECELSNLRYALVFNHRLDRIVPETSLFVNLHFALRVDVVPENQRDPNGYKFLIPVSYGYMQKGSLVTKAKGYPFFFPVIEGELFRETKKRLIETIGWDSEEDVTYRFHGDKMLTETVVGDEVVISEIGTEKSQLIVISKEDTKPIHRKLNALQNAPVRIYN